jgi:sialidase-1
MMHSMKKLFVFGWIALWWLNAAGQQLKIASPSSSDSFALYVSGRYGYESYRIPSIITTIKGTVLAFCEARKKPGDAGDIDLVFRRSTDNGKSWSKQKIIWNDGDNTCGNPCPVIDRSTGTIWLLLTHNLGEDREAAIQHNTAASTRTVWVCYSKDDGITWSEPAEITADTKKSSWGWYATGPGVGIQLRYGPHKGRMVIPCDHSYTIHTDQGDSVKRGDHIIYSDDHGLSWHLGGVITPKVNECQVVEVADGNGTLLMNMRSYFGSHTRTQSTSYDGGASWTAPVEIPELVEPVCQASIIRYSWPGKNKPGSLFFLNPASSAKRHNMAIRISYDEGKTWPFIRTLHAGPSAYSSLTVLRNNEIGCLYEAGEKKPYERIIFQRLKITY